MWVAERTQPKADPPNEQRNRSTNTQTQIRYQTMKITARFHGILTDYVTPDAVDFDMGSHPTYGDLLKEIGHRFSRDMPSQLWDGSKDDFHGSVLAMGEDRTLASQDTPLKADEEITFYLMLAGG